MFHIDELRHQIEALIRDNPVLEEDDVLRADMLDAETDLKGALTMLLHTMDDSDDLITGIVARRQKLIDRKTRLERRVEALRELMLRLLQSANLKRLELPEVTLSQTNRPPQLIGEPDVNELPDELVRIKREPDRVKIREALLRGVVVPGCVLSNAAPGLTLRGR